MFPWGKDFSGSGNGAGDKTYGLPRYRPWYASRFKNISELDTYWGRSYGELKARTAVFTDCLYSSTIPPEIIEAVTANLSILKSPTVLRQHDGRLWAWEGCCDAGGCCHGTCTHVWNYAQALAHLFPDLERTIRKTEFFECQNDAGHQNFRARLPIGPADHNFHAAADGQLGGIMKTCRDWRISGDTGWLRKMWPKVQQSLDYCIATWDPRHEGVIEEPHHNTYDIEFWGPDAMCSSFYLGALHAAGLMAAAIGEQVPLYAELEAKCRKQLEKNLYNGEYFIQKILWEGLNATDPSEEADKGINQQKYSTEALELLKKEGPKYQYGKGCLSDGVLGAWIARVCGMDDILNARKTRSHLKSVFKYNFKKSLAAHANPQRPTYALNDEGGLLLCTWPKGGALSLPFVYSNEVWTGIEYHVAAHLIMLGEIDKGLEIVRTVRALWRHEAQPV